ncbi:hypothetical protein IIA79_05095 [bacterium]|nr:hypothetical protein [bacterium]
MGTEGGNQNRAFENAMKLLSLTSQHVTTVAVIDGIPWIRGSGKMSNMLENHPGNVVTALLLKDFLADL